KLFIGGITVDTTEIDLKDHFEKFGALTDVVVMRNNVTHKGRGFGFVTYLDPDVAKSVIGKKHVIRERTVDVKSAVREGVAPASKGGGQQGGGLTKIFVGGIPPGVSSADMRAYFEPFGPVTDAAVMIDQATQRSRGFGFVTF
ncbi:hypothetical protein T484DRAFT_1603305, partial [Baffinella frigidus]